jgi:tetratricopeptide (TPR) repeat protein
VAELTEELAAARDRLTLMDTDFAEVTLAFDVSYRSMREDTQQFFRGLGLHPGVNFDTYACAALNGVSLNSARKILDELLDRHLVIELSRGRYEFHDLVRQYAKNLAMEQEPSSNEAAIDRLFDYYLHTAMLANIHLARRSRSVFSPVDQVPLWLPDFSTPQKSFSWMESERQNLDSVIEYSVKTSRYRTVIELPAMMSGFLCTKGLWMHAIGLHYEALKTARDSGQVHGQVLALNQIGHIQRLLSDYRQAIITQGQAVELAHSSDDKQGLANARDSLGVVHYLQGDYELSNKCLLEALKIFTALDDHLGKGEALLHLGALQQATGKYPSARETLTEALRYQRQLGHTLGEAETLNYLGVVEYLTGDYPTSIKTLTRAKEIQSSLDDRLGEAEVLNNLGAVFCETGDYSRSIDNLRESLEIYEDLGNRRGQSSVLNNIGLLLLEMRDGEDAARILNQALHINREIRNQRGEGNSLSRLGVAAARRYNYDSAIIYLNDALTIFRTLGDRRGQAEVLNYLGDAYQESDLPRRESYHNEALAIAREISVPLEEAHALASLARVCFIREDSRNGAMNLSKALSILQKLGVSRNYIARHADLGESGSSRSQ